MTIRVTGIVHGSRIELNEPPALPDGSPVVVQIEPRELSLEEKKKLADELCGAWADDPSLAPIFERIEKERHSPSTRQVPFDDLP